jgi:RNA polymerase sigma-70 factor, ECF subfamily
MSSTLDQDSAAFETHRRALIGLAYRMLSSLSEAEDIVQEAYLRSGIIHLRDLSHPTANSISFVSTPPE